MPNILVRQHDFPSKRVKYARPDLILCVLCSELDALKKSAERKRWPVIIFLYDFVGMNILKFE